MLKGSVILIFPFSLFDVGGRVESIGLEGYVLESQIGVRIRVAVCARK